MTETTTHVFEAAEEFDGATVALQDGSAFDIKAALKDGKGRIETDDETLAIALAGHPALKPGRAAKAAPIRASQDADSTDPSGPNGAGEEA